MIPFPQGFNIFWKQFTAFTWSFASFHAWQCVQSAGWGIALQAPRVNFGFVVHLKFLLGCAPLAVELKQQHQKRGGMLRSFATQTTNPSKEINCVQDQNSFSIGHSCCHSSQQGFLVSYSLYSLVLCCNIPLPYTVLLAKYDHNEDCY